jgi:hypothetical protein
MFIRKGDGNRVVRCPPGCLAYHSVLAGARAVKVRRRSSSHAMIGMSVAPAPDSVTWPGENLNQIQFLLGYASVQTTEHYLGCKQELRHAVNELAQR